MLRDQNVKHPIPERRLCTNVCRCHPILGERKQNGMKTQLKNTEHQYTIDALAQSRQSDNKITLTKLTLIDGYRFVEIYQDLVRSDKIF